MLDKQITTGTITCPVCKGNSFSATKKGLILKKTVYECISCNTSLETGNGKDFTVIKVGESYSNAESLIVGHKAFSLNELSNHNFPIIPDAQLALFAEGDIPDEIYEKPDQITIPVILKKNEFVAFTLKNIEYCEERQKRVSSGGGSYSFRITKGVWFHTGKLSSPQYTSVIQGLDTGMLIVTSLRFVFVGNKKNIDQPLTKITSITPFRDGIGIARSNKQKTEYFKGDYHWPVISSIFIGLIKKVNQ